VGLEHFRDKTVTKWIRAIAEGNVTGVQETFHLSCFQPDQNPTYYGHADSQLRRELRAACEHGLGVSPVVHKPIRTKTSHSPTDREDGSMKIVAVTACPTGIAHTYMAAARLEKIAQNYGHEIKVETQGAIGIENKLTENDIRQAEIAIFAVDVQIEGLERFNGIKIIQVPLKEAINNTESIFSKLPN
jgi:fructose-specific phosphotransferase system IIB component